MDIHMTMSTHMQMEQLIHMAMSIHIPMSIAEIILIQRAHMHIHMTEIIMIIVMNICMNIPMQMERHTAIHMTMSIHTITAIPILMQMEQPIPTVMTTHMEKARGTRM